AYPGPVCYGRGGTRATITDANLVLGYLDEEQFLGGRLKLDRASAVKALEEAGAPLGLSAVETALAARRIIISQMADLIRQMTVEQGMDPRGFALYSYGGAGGLHVAGYLKELGCSRAIIPLGTLSTTWSAYGCATSDLIHIEGHAVSMVAPFDAEALREIFAQLESKARAELLRNGIPEDKIELTRLVEMKYPLQIHHVEVEMPEGHIDEALCEALEERFAQRYEQLYGRGAAFTGAKSELVSCQVLGR